MCLYTFYWLRRGKIYFGRYVVLQKSRKAVDIGVQPVYACFSRSKVWLHKIGKVHIIGFGNMLQIIGIEPMLVFIQLKVEAAVTGGYRCTAAQVHPVGRAPVLSATVSITNTKVRKFFFNSVQSNTSS